MKSVVDFLSELTHRGPPTWNNKLLFPRRSDGTIINIKESASTVPAYNGILITRRGGGKGFILNGLMKTNCGTGTRFDITFDSDVETGMNLAGDVYVDNPSDATGVEGVDFFMGYENGFEKVRYTSNTPNYSHWLTTCHSMINACAATTPDDFIWDMINDKPVLSANPKYFDGIESAEDKKKQIIADFVTANNTDCRYFKALRPRRFDGSIVEDLWAPADIAQCGIFIEKSSFTVISFIGSINGVVGRLAQIRIYDNGYFIRGEIFVSDESEVTGTEGIDYIYSERRNGLYYWNNPDSADDNVTIDVAHWIRSATDILLECIATLPPGPIIWDSVGSSESNAIDREAIYDITKMARSLISDGYMRSPLQVQISNVRLEAARIASDKAAEELLMEEAAEAARLMGKKLRNAKRNARKKNNRQTKRLADLLMGIELTDEPKIVNTHRPVRGSYNPLKNESYVAPPAAPAEPEIEPEIESETVYEDDESDNECDFCMEWPRTAIALPCKHANMCSACARACIHAKKFNCIKCRCLLDGYWLQDEGRSVECV